MDGMPKVRGKQGTIKGEGETRMVYTLKWP
jgi:hypothetical protein